VEYRVQNTDCRSFPADTRITFGCAILACALAGAAGFAQPARAQTILPPASLPAPFQVLVQAQAQAHQAYADEAAEDAPLPEEGAPEIDWSVLNIDPARLGSTGSRGKISIATIRSNSPSQWKRTENSDGSAAITVDRKLYTSWDAKIGIDMGLAAARSPLPALGGPASGAATGQSGIAWARTSAPALNLPIGWDNASLDARFDPAQEQGRLGARFGRSIALNNSLSVTMENGVSLTHALAPADGAANVFDTDPAAKLNFLATGTSLGIGSRLSSADYKWMNSLRAEQKFSGGVTVTGTVSETPEGEISKTFTAGFKRAW
jgi:hypothetical protein